VTSEVPSDQPHWAAPSGDRQTGLAPAGPEHPPAAPWAPVRGPQGGAPPVPPPPREAWHRPRRLDAVPGTPFGVLQLDVPPLTSGLAIGGLVAGIASILLSLVVICFGLAGASAGWGPWAAGAFALLAGLVGAAGVVLGALARRQIGRARPAPAVQFTGRGLALAGLICAAVGLALTVAAFALAMLVQLA
jgi:hypothetical protein